MTTAALYTLYAFLAVGAAGLYLGLPAARTADHPARRAGSILAAAALTALAVFWTRWIGPDFQGRAFFVIFAAVAVVAAVRVVACPRPIYSALYFVLLVLAVAGLSVLAAAEFLAAALVIVYAGAILVTYVFVIMLAQQADVTPYDRVAREPMAAVVLGFAMAAAVTQAMVSIDPIASHEPRAPDVYVQRISDGGNATASPAAGGSDETSAAVIDPAAVNGDRGNVRALGETLTRTYIVAIEIGGVLLLVAMVGAFAIARKRIEPEDLTPRERADLRAEQEDLHRRGRQVEPF